MAIGSHDLVLDLAASALRGATRGSRWRRRTSARWAGSTALRDGLCHLAGSHLLDPESGEYTLPWIERLLPGRDVAVVRLAHREQGLIVAPGQPARAGRDRDSCARACATSTDSAAPARACCSTTSSAQARHRAGRESSGYAREEHTHLAVAAAVAAGRADCGLGVLAAARAFGLGFVPVAKEPYDLVLDRAGRRRRRCSPRFGSCWPRRSSRRA